MQKIPPMEEYLAFLNELADTAGNIIRPYFRAAFTVTDKSDSAREFDPVTEADREAEQAMRRQITERFPDHGILGEEFGEKKGTAPDFWVLDPIDGTRAFISGIPLWGTLIALNDGTRPVLGLIDQPILGERYIGGPHGAFLGARQLHTRPCAHLRDAVMFTTTPEMFQDESLKSTYDRLSAEVRMQRFGADCYAYAMLAMGMIDLVVENLLQPYDIQGPMVVVEAAGGIVTDARGGSAQNGGFIVAAGDARLHAQVIDMIARGT